MAAVGAIGHALRARELRRRAQREHLVVLGRHRAIAALDRVRRARSSPRRSSRDRRRPSPGSGFVTLSMYASARPSEVSVFALTLPSAPPPIRYDAATIEFLRLGRHHAAAAVAERDHAGDVVERVVPAARAATRRSCRRASSGPTPRCSAGSRARPGAPHRRRDRRSRRRAARCARGPRSPRRRAAATRRNLNCCSGEPSERAERSRRGSVSWLNASIALVTIIRTRGGLT